MGPAEGYQLGHTFPGNTNDSLTVFDRHYGSFRLASCSGAGSHGTRVHDTDMIHQNYFGYLNGARFRPDLFSTYFNYDANKQFPHIQTNEDSRFFAHAIVNSRPSSDVCVQDLLTRDLLFLANEWRSIGNGTIDTSIPRQNRWMSVVPQMSQQQAPYGWDAARGIGQ